MNKFTEFLLKYRGVVILAFAIIFALGAVGTGFLVASGDKINSDMLGYLDEDFDTTKGLEFLKTNFGIRGDSMVVVRGVDNDEELRASVEKIREMEGVSRLIWVEDAIAIEELESEIRNLDFEGLENVDYDALEKLLTGAEDNANIKRAIEVLKENFNVDLSGFSGVFGLKDMTIDTSSLKEFLKRDLGDGQYQYVFIMMLSLPPSSEEAYALSDDIRAELAPRELAISGTTETAKALLADTLGDLPNFLIFAFLAAIVILFLATSSFVDPLIILVTIGVSLVISMGANYLYPSISVISFATSAVLQLAVTLDYSIFYMHTYKRNRKLLDPWEATKKSIPQAASSILASGLTTVGGFAALFCMRFGIGSDLAGVLIKGVLLSLVTILILQPVLTFMLDTAIAKTTHDFSGMLTEKIRKKKPEFPGFDKDKVVRPVAKFSVFARIVLVVVAVGLIVPAYFGQSALKYSYFKMYEETEATSESTLAEELGNQMILAVPIDTVKGTHKEFIEKIMQEPNGKVSGVIGAFNMVDADVETMKFMLEILTDDKMVDSVNSAASMLNLIANHDEQIAERLRNYGIDIDAILDEFREYGVDLEKLSQEVDLENFDFNGKLGDVDLSGLNSYFAKVGDKWYTIYSVGITGSTEDDAAAETYRYILETRREFFGSEGYSIGMLTGSYDMRETTPRDFMMVTLVSAAIIFVIVSVLLRNPLKSLILVVLIELGIWLNLSLTYLIGEQLNFMVYIIITGVQLGCTVDYAILLANTFENNRKNYKSGKECAINSAVEAVPAIFVSALLIIAICTAVNLASGNLIIKQLTGMLARGAAISFVLVTVVQTAVMSFFKTERKKKDYAEKLKNLEAQEAGTEAETGNGSSEK